MPMNNSLNVSELLKRLGVVGDSQGSASILDSMRLVINLADFSDLVPPLRVPVGGATSLVSSGVGTFNGWTLACRSPGGLQVLDMHTNQGTTLYHVWQTDTDPFAHNMVLIQTIDFVFEQTAQAELLEAVPGAAVAPPGTLLVRAEKMDLLNGVGWVGPGQFFNIESRTSNVPQQMLSITWKEFPAMINP